MTSVVSAAGPPGARCLVSDLLQFVRLAPFAEISTGACSFTIQRAGNR